MLLQAILCAFAALFFRLDNGTFGMNHIDRPIVICPVIGLIMGDLTTGVLFGAIWELILMGVVVIGASSPPDAIVSSVFGTCFAVISGLDVRVALIVALPVALLFPSIGRFNARFAVQRSRKTVAFAQEGDYRGVERMLRIGIASWGMICFVITFLGVYFGCGYIIPLVNVLPEAVIGIFELAGSLFPALGIALLMSFIYTKVSAPLLFVGFVLTAFLGLNMVGLAVLACALAVFLYQRDKSLKEAV